MALSKTQKQAFVVTSLDDVAAFFGVDRSLIKSWVDAGMPRTYTGTGRGRYSYNLWEITPWLRKKGPWRYPRGGGGKGENRGVKSGTEIAEETQRVKLAKEKLNLDIQRKKLVDVSEVREALLRWSHRRRREIDTARKQYGDEVASFLNDGLIEEKRVIDDDFHGPSTDGDVLGDGTGNGTASNADQPVG